MKYSVSLSSEASKSYRSTRAANSLDIKIDEKLKHDLSVEADLAGQWKIGLILGASGSGKTTLAKEMFGESVFSESVARLDDSLTILDQMPTDLSYDDCANILLSVGLTSVPCWLRPVRTLSNGQRFRAQVALALSWKLPMLVIDEWTSVVDRVVGKIMSACVAKAYRSSSNRIVLVSCHYDVVEWLNPDWIVDCNTGQFIDRRLLPRVRSERLNFDIRECDKSTWKYFSKYHYLSAKLAAGKNYFFGLYQGENQIGFGAFSNYVPKKVGKPMMLHSNRVVIHPDYAGIGLGLSFVNETSRIIKSKGYDVYASFSSLPMYRARVKDPARWRLIRSENRIGHYKKGGKLERAKKGFGTGGFRENVRLFVFKYVGP